MVSVTTSLKKVDYYCIIISIEEILKKKQIDL